MVWRKADAAMRRVLNTTLPNSFLSSLQEPGAEPSAERKESEVREGPRKGDDGGDDDFTAEKVEIALNKLFGDKSKKAIIGQSEASLVTRINHVKKGTKKRKLDANANHVAKKQQMAHEPPTDVEVEDEFKMSETEKSNWESDQDGF
ncbi:hypothetical protein PC128_g9462 [Phytophthora cactorum]|nr:hypothetical protein PC128_g9462 [Phytophthora cactorum]